MSHSAITVPQSEMEELKAICHRLKQDERTPKSYCIVTFGCQMNAHDSEKIAGMLTAMGMVEAPDRTQADMVIFNTCCVRDNAERKALGNVIWLAEMKKQNPSLIIAVCGCMVQQPHMAQKILKQYPFIDLAFGTHNLYRLPALLQTVLEEKRRVVSITGEEYTIAEGVPIKRLSGSHAYITIMYGCDNFCSYCVVPYVRGRERSRKPEDILREAEGLLQAGVQEIMLLGQNVNSYGKGLQTPESFPKLLRELDRLGVPRIRFMTSHPKDLSEELALALADCKHVCNHFHLPLQSGNNEILRRMNRCYTVEDYLKKVEMLRSAVPSIGITSDLIVGFPGETEAQFEDTCSVVKQVGYDAAFTFIYSPRQGTRAAEMPGQIPPEEATRRIERLISIVEENSLKIRESLIGTREEVLVLNLSKRDASQVSGKGRRNITVTFPGSESDRGKIIPVKILNTAANTLRGEKIQ